MSVEKFSNLINDADIGNSPSSVLVVRTNWSVYEVLQASVLDYLLSYMQETRKLAIALVKNPSTSGESEFDGHFFTKLAGYRFTPDIRKKNLGMHIDAIDRLESVNQRGTLLFSGVGSFSSIPTVFSQTHISDKETAKYDYFGFLSNKEHELFDEVCARVGKMLPPGSTGYATSVQNIFLANRELNRKYDGEPLRKRDLLTQKILGKETSGEFITQGDESSILIFPNGMGEYRGISHGRFLSAGEEAVSQGNVINISIDNGGILRGNRRVEGMPMEGIEYSHGLTNDDRLEIVP